MKAFMMHRCPRLTAWWYLAGRVSWPMCLVSSGARRRYAESVTCGEAIREAVWWIQWDAALSQADEESPLSRSETAVFRSIFGAHLELPAKRGSEA